MTDDSEQKRQFIVRASHDSRYTKLSNLMLEDTRLSWSARGLLAYLLTKPSGWQVRTSHLISQGEAGRDAIYSMLKQLKEFGYVLMHRQPDGGVSYEVHECPPTSGESVSGLATSGKPTNGKPTSGKSSRIVITETAVSTEKASKTGPDLLGINPRKMGSVTIKTYIAACVEAGIDAVPGDDPIFEYTEKVGIPREMVALAWYVFRDTYIDTQQKQSSWLQHFRNAVRKNWGKVWYLQDGGGWALTTAGRQAKAAYATPTEEESA